VSLAVLLGMLVRVTRSMLVKLLGAIGTLKLVTLAGKSKNAGQHQNREKIKFHRAAS
jgi:hypothetical protein